MSTKKKDPRHIPIKLSRLNSNSSQSNAYRLDLNTNEQSNNQRFSLSNIKIKPLNSLYKSKFSSKNTSSSSHPTNHPNIPSHISGLSSYSQNTKYNTQYNPHPLYSNPRLLSQSKIQLQPLQNLDNPSPTVGPVPSSSYQSSSYQSTSLHSTPSYRLSQRPNLFNTNTLNSSSHNLSNYNTNTQTSFSSNRPPYIPSNPIQIPIAKNNTKYNLPPINIKNQSPIESPIKYKLSIDSNESPKSFGDMISIDKTTQQALERGNYSNSPINMETTTSRPHSQEVPYRHMVYSSRPSSTPSQSKRGSPRLKSFRYIKDNPDSGYSSRVISRENSPRKSKQFDFNPSSLHHIINRKILEPLKKPIDFSKKIEQVVKLKPLTINNIFPDKPSLQSTSTSIDYNPSKLLKSPKDSNKNISDIITENQIDNTFYKASNKMKGLRQEILSRKPRRLCRNSTNSMFIDQTMQMPNDTDVLKSVSYLIHRKICESENIPKSMRVILPVFELKFSEMEIDPSLFDKPPTELQVFGYIKSIFERAQLSSECNVIAIAYLERIMSGTKVVLTPTNWHGLVFGAYCLASKIWDDLSMKNFDFSLACPVFTIKDINKFEIDYVNNLNYNIEVKGSLYAAVYFMLREIYVQHILTRSPEYKQKECENTSNYNNTLKRMNSSLARKLIYGLDHDTTNQTSLKGTDLKRMSLKALRLSDPDNTENRNIIPQMPRKSEHLTSGL